MAAQSTYVLPFPQFESVLKNADHVDVKTVEGDVNLRQFVAAMISYQPAWMTFLYRLRGFFVLLLGMKQDAIPRAALMRPEDVPMTHGSKAHFFTVSRAEEDRYWLAEIKDQHLDAALGVMVETLESGRTRFKVITIVRYNNWAGPVYFNIIRPFHHLVVGSMARAGARGR
jgi:hypothetical protein